MERFEFEGFGYRQVDFQCRQQRLCCLVVELEALDEFHITHAGGLCGELPQRPRLAGAVVSEQ